jgi:hypothetical protein
MDCPIFIWVLAFIYEKFKMGGIQTPRAIRQDLVELSYAPELWVYSRKTVDEPLKRATCQQKLFLQNIDEVLVLVATHRHDGQVVVDVLVEDFVLGLVVQVLPPTIVVVDQEELREIEVLHVLGEPGQQQVVLVNSAVDQEDVLEKCFEVDALVVGILVVDFA